MSTRVAYLGPVGTYAEKAAKALAALEKLDAPQFIPCKGLRSVVDNLAKNLCEAAVVPIENSVEGAAASYIILETYNVATIDENSQNDDFELADDTILDFTESNPFGDAGMK